MYEIRTTAYFDRWIRSLKSEALRLRIAARFRHLALGNMGDCKAVGEGVVELRYHFGPGYRVYLTRRGSQIMLLLAGGDKNSQSRDIALAISLAKEETENG